MAVFAALGCLPVHDHGLTLDLLSLVAFQAGHTPVRAFEFVAGAGVVIEIGHLPLFDPVALCARLGRIGQHELTRMDVAVTGQARAVVVAIAAVCSLLVGECGVVAGEARLSQVSALQGKPRGGVVFHRKQGGHKALHGMTALAAALVGASGELPAVHVGVAIRAMRVRHEGEPVPGGMALLAGRIHVPAAQGEIGAVVIERFLRHGAPAVGAVALRAVRTETIGMGVLVAVGAGCVRHLGENVL